MKKILYFAAVILFLWVSSAYAVPISVDVQWGSSSEGNIYFADYPGYTSFYTDYSLNTDLYGNVDAFCVEGVASGSGFQPYEQISVPTNLANAAWVADQYWHNPHSVWDISKEFAQLLIWELAIDSSSWTGFNFGVGDFRYTGGQASSLFSFYMTHIYPNIFTAQSTPSISLVYNPTGEYTGDPTAYQDFLINHPVPEPTTMLLFGLGVLGITALGRKRLLNRNRGE